MTTTRDATCACGQLRIAVAGDPLRISICHCLDCQRRTGSIFGAQARFGRDQVVIVDGRSSQFTRTADSGNPVTFHFCPGCGTTLFWELGAYPDLVAIAVGAFADPGFPPPRHSVYDSRRHPWAFAAGELPMEHLG